MALRDLVASTSALTEETIEAIVSDFVRYDTDEAELVLLPKFTGLLVAHKVLIFLAALHGWRFIVDGEVAVSMKPSEIEAKTGIPGGSLRPALRKLSDQKLLASKGGAYFVKPASLVSIQNEVRVRDTGSSQSSKPRRVVKAKAAAASKPAASTAPRTPRRATSSNLQAKFDSLYDEGFFSEQRTLNDLEIRFHEEAVIVRRTSIPKLLLRGVTAGRLKRVKADVGGRKLWVYSNKKNPSE